MAEGLITRPMFSNVITGSRNIHRANNLLRRESVGAPNPSDKLFLECRIRYGCRGMKQALLQSAVDDARELRRWFEDPASMSASGTLGTW